MKSEFCGGLGLEKAPSEPTACPAGDAGRRRACRPLRGGKGGRGSFPLLLRRRNSAFFRFTLRKTPIIRIRNSACRGNVLIINRYNRGGKKNEGRIAHVIQDPPLFQFCQLLIHNVFLPSFHSFSRAASQADAAWPPPAAFYSKSLFRRTLKGSSVSMTRT